MIPLADPAYGRACVELYRERGGGWIPEKDIKARIERNRSSLPPLPRLALPLPPLPLPPLPLPPLPKLPGVPA